MEFADWNAPFLEIFKCRIQVPRPDIEVPADAVDGTISGHPSIEYSREVQKSVYHQISFLTSLTDLDLGHLNWGDNIVMQWYSLEMTLESGLSVLASLKNLQRLNVAFTNHRIGVSDFEWMASEWPNMQRLTGLFENGQDRDSAVVAWLEINRPAWVDTSAPVKTDLSENT